MPAKKNEYDGITDEGLKYILSILTPMQAALEDSARRYAESNAELARLGLDVSAPAKDADSDFAKKIQGIQAELARRASR